MKGTLQLIFLFLVLTALAQSLWQHGHLPDKVAAHFNGSGEADGWMARGTQTAWNMVTILFMTAVFQGLALLPSRLSKEHVNIPHRDYWLAPERAAATHDRIAVMLLAMGCAVILYFIALFHLFYRANLNPPPRLGGSIWWLTGLLLVVVVSVTAALLSKFSRKPAA